MDPVEIKPGELRHRVTVKEKTQTGTGTRGEPLVTWPDRFERWAKVETLSGRKAEIARQLVAQATHLITLRWNGDVTVNDRVIFKGRTFNVGHLADVDERRIRLELTCTEQKT